MKFIKKIFEWFFKKRDLILGLIKLFVSILAPIAFLTNAPLCEYLYPGFDKDWDIFIPMDMLCHDTWSFNIFLYAVASTIKTRYYIGDAFLYFGMSLCGFDVLDRNFFHIYNTILLDLIFVIPCSIAFATLIYVRTNRNRKINP